MTAYIIYWLDIPEIGLVFFCFEFRPKNSKVILNPSTLMRQLRWQRVWDEVFALDAVICSFSAVVFQSNEVHAVFYIDFILSTEALLYLLNVVFCQVFRGQ